MIPLPRHLPAAAVTAAVALTLSSCSVLPRTASYRVTAYFTKAVSFYPGSRVQVMGVNVGKVDSVTPVNGQVRVIASIDKDVPLPATTTAAIVPLSLIGERTLTFTPPWRPGMPKLAEGSVLHQDRTRIPVEVNDALKSFGRLLDSFDPVKANVLLGNVAATLDGNGTAFNRTFQQTGRLVTDLAGQDQQLLKVAKNLNQVAGAVRGREKILGTLVESFADSSKMLADERKNIRTLIEAIADLARRGKVLIEAHQKTLPDDLVRIAQVALMIKGSSGSVSKFLQSLPDFSYQFVNSYEPKGRTLVARIVLNNFLRSYLTAILKEPWPSSKVPCPLPPPYSNCT